MATIIKVIHEYNTNYANNKIIINSDGEAREIRTIDKESESYKKVIANSDSDFINMLYDSDQKAISDIAGERGRNIICFVANEIAYIACVHFDINNNRYARLIISAPEIKENQLVIGRFYDDYTARDADYNFSIDNGVIHFCGKRLKFEDEKLTEIG